MHLIGTVGYVHMVPYSDNLERHNGWRQATRGRYTRVLVRFLPTFISNICFAYTWHMYSICTAYASETSATPRGIYSTCVAYAKHMRRIAVALV